MKYIIFIFSLLLLCACTTKKPEHHTAATKHDSILPPKVTILANLPDSLKPKVVALDTMPKPRRLEIAVRSGI